MPWKLIFFTIALTIVVLFIGSNLGNACAVNFFWIKQVENVPVFMSILISFALGVIIMVPFVFIKKHSHSGRNESIKTKKNSLNNVNTKNESSKIVYNSGKLENEKN
ncbi:MAG: hypothetical protein ACTTHG_01990 [Treponemataceae bacterium]